jgi:hypothetical protein
MNPSFREFTADEDRALSDALARGERVIARDLRMTTQRPEDSAEPDGGRPTNQQ